LPFEVLLGDALEHEWLRGEEGSLGGREVLLEETRVWLGGVPAVATRDDEVVTRI
jgi:hypothetical protein